VIDYVQIILAFIDLGIPKLIQKFYTNNQDSLQNDLEISSFWTAFTYLRVFSYFLGIVLIGFSFSLSSIANLGLILAIFSLQFILVSDLAFRSICDAKGHTWQFSFTDLGNRLILVFGLVIFDFIKSGLKSGLNQNITGLNYFLSVTAISYAVGIVADAVWQRKYYNFQRFDISKILSLLRTYLKPIAYLALSGLTVASYLQTRKIILNSYGYDVDLVNGFGNAEKIFILVGIVPGLTMPTIASLVKKRLDQKQVGSFGLWFKQNLNWSFNKSILGEWLSYIFIFSLVLTIGMLLFGPLIVWLIDSTGKYQSAYRVLPIFSLGMLPYTLVLFLANLIIFLNGEKYELYGSIILAIFGLGLYFWLIPSGGIFGAAWATVMIFFLDLILKIFFLRMVLDKQSGIYKA
jgi:O-antigen/teichoic acid export membrane protein